MKFMKKNQKRIALVMAVISILTLAIGSLAYFSDRITFNTIFHAADASKIINVTPKDDGTPSTDPGKDLENKWKVSNEALIFEALLRPGDVYDLGYKLTNRGADVVVRETFIITIKDSLEQPMTSLDQTSPEWRLFSAYTTDKYGAKDGTTVISKEIISGNQIKYEITPFVLKAGEAKNLVYYAILDKYAGNEFQNSKCEVEYLVELCQYIPGEVDSLETYEGWKPLCTAKITFGGNSAYPAVPAA